MALFVVLSMVLFTVRLYIVPRSFLVSGPWLVTFISILAVSVWL